MSHLSLVIFSLLLGVTPLWAQAGDDEAILRTLTTVTPRDTAITQGLTWLRTQVKTDGSLAEGNHRVALTSLGLMAHLAAGITPKHREHGPFLTKGLEWVLQQQDPTGYFGKNDNSRMYGHGITTLLLSQALGMTSDPALEERLRQAVDKAILVTVAAAKVNKPEGHRGGWRYQPNSGDSDLSLSGWQFLGLHAAQNIGISVDPQVISAATGYVQSCITKEGLVSYTPKSGEAPALRGLALVCLVATGADEDPRLSKVVQRIQSDPITWGCPHFFYRAYYDSVGLSRKNPEAWLTYRGILENALLPRQQADGSWPNSEAGPIYTTSMAVLALAVERHLLPAYQR
jgi:hypothetical protein